MNDIQLLNYLALASAVPFYVAFLATGITSKLLLVAFVVRRLWFSRSFVKIVKVYRLRSVSPVVACDLGHVASLTSLIGVQTSGVLTCLVVCILECAIPISV